MAIVIEINVADFYEYLIKKGNSKNYAFKIIQEIQELEQTISLDDLIGKNIRSRYPKYVFGKINDENGEYAFIEQYKGYLLTVVFNNLSNKDKIMFIHRKNNGSDCLTPLALTK